MKKILTILLVSALSLFSFSGCSTTQLTHEDGVDITYEASFVATTYALEKVFQDNPEKTVKALKITNQASAVLKSALNQEDLSPDNIVLLLDSAGVNEIQDISTQLVIRVVLNRYNSFYDRYQLSNNVELAKEYVLAIVRGVDDAVELFENSISSERVQRAETFLE